MARENRNMKHGKATIQRSSGTTAKKAAIGAGLVALVAAFGYWGSDTTVSKQPSVPQAAAKAPENKKPLLEQIEEEQKLKKEIDPKSEAKPLVQHTKPGVKFIPDKAPPVARLIQDPEMGEVIELTYADGSKLYKPNDPVYDWGTGEVHEQELTN